MKRFAVLLTIGVFMALTVPVHAAPGKFPIFLSWSLRISAHYGLFWWTPTPLERPSPRSAGGDFTLRFSPSSRSARASRLQLVDAVNSPGRGVSDATSNGGIESGLAPITLQPTP